MSRKDDLEAMLTEATALLYMLAFTMDVRDEHHFDVLSTANKAHNLLDKPIAPFVSSVSR